MWSVRFLPTRARLIRETGRQATAMREQFMPLLCKRWVGHAIVAATVWLAPRATANQASKLEAPILILATSAAWSEWFNSGRTLVSAWLATSGDVDFGRWIPRGLPGSRALSRTPRGEGGLSGSSRPLWAPDCSPRAPVAVSPSRPGSAHLSR